MKIMILMMVAVSLSACGPEMVEESQPDSGAEIDAGTATPDAGTDCSLYEFGERKCCMINERFDAPTDSCIFGSPFN